VGLLQTTDPVMTRTDENVKLVEELALSLEKNTSGTRRTVPAVSVRNKGTLERLIYSFGLFKM